MPKEKEELDMANPNNNIKSEVRCGLQPIKDVEYYDITTSYAERFLGDQIRRLEDELRIKLREKNTVQRQDDPSIDKE